MSSSTSAYRKNPFPYLGTIRIAGERFERGAPMAAGKPRTLPREPIQKLKGFVNDYCERFTPQWSGDGAITVIRGAHGSGKTHTIFAVWQEIASSPRLYPIYVLQQNADLLTFYQKVVSGIEFSFLKQLSRSLLGSFTAEQLSPEIQDAELLERVTLQLKEAPDSPSIVAPPKPSALPNPELTTAHSEPSLSAVQQTPSPSPTLAKLFSSYRVEAGAAEARQKQALNEMTQGFPNLEKAVRHLQGDKFDKPAYDWLSCSTVSPQDLEAMGLSGPIDTSEEAVAALELLSALFSIGNRALLLFIDQYEKLVTDEDNLLSGRNAGSLRSLAESFVSRNSMLVLSGNDEAWRRLPSDFRDRVGSLNQVVCTILRLDEAIDILRLYLTPLEVEFVPNKTDHLEPFTETTVRTMLELRGGNPRRLLQLAWGAMQKHPGSGKVIDSDFITEVAREATEQFVDRQTVGKSVERYLARQPFRLETHYQLNDLAFDFALCHPDGSPALLMDVRSAIFHDDEAAGAVRTAEIVGQMKGLQLRAAYGIVATGYVSPEIVDTLSSQVARLIVYSPDTFNSEMSALMARVPEVAPAPPPAVPPVHDDSAAKLAEVRELLLKISEERKNQNIVIEQRSSDLAVNQEARRYEERRDETRREWTEQRRKLEAEIQRVRSARMNADLEELERLRNAAERRRNFRDILFFLGAIIPLILLFPPILHPLTKFFQLSYLETQLDLFAFLLVCFFLLAWDRVDMLLLDLPSRVNSMRDLEQLAVRPPRFWFFLKGSQSNPLVRYLRKVHRVLDGYYLRISLASSMIASEPLRILRQALARVFLSELDKKEFKLDDSSLLSNADLLLFLEHPKVLAAPISEKDSINFPQDLIRALKSGRAVGKDRFSVRLATVASGIAPDPASSPTPSVFNLPDYGTLSMVFETGLDRALAGMLYMLTERSLQEALHELSPFEEGGLGTYDYLASIKTVDRMFLFVSQLLLYFERDLLQYPPPSPMPR